MLSLTSFGCLFLWKLGVVCSKWSAKRKPVMVRSAFYVKGSGGMPLNFWQQVNR
ncbi:hypothetical protein D3C78_630190 [compost metagenome]